MSVALPLPLHHGTRPVMPRLLRVGALAGPPAVVVAVPVRNEAERIGPCIAALAATLAPLPRAGVVLLVNNSDDGSAGAALVALAAHGVSALLAETTLLPGMATAGWARRLALDLAARWAAPDAVLMTTDADGRVAPDWAASNLAELEAGAHLVCGAMRGDPGEAARLPPAIAAPAALEARYTALATELDARLDPRPHDPWPHHGLASGASLALRVRDYHALGGLPPLPCSEDRALAALAERADLRVRHSGLARVTVSCRVQGRAPGGMASAIAARIADPDSLADERLMPAAVTARRARARRALRRLWAGEGDPAPFLRGLGLAGVPPCGARFGSLWAAVEAHAPALAAPRMRPSDLARDLPELERLVRRARSAR